MIKELRTSFSELEKTGQYHGQKERYPFFAELRIPTGTDAGLRQNFLDELHTGLSGTEYIFFAGTDGLIRYGFKSEADRDVLFRARASENFDYNVRKRMETPGLCR